MDAPCNVAVDICGTLYNVSFVCTGHSVYVPVNICGTLMFLFIFMAQ